MRKRSRRGAESLRCCERWGAPDARLGEWCPAEIHETTSTSTSLGPTGPSPSSSSSPTSSSPTGPSPSSSTSPTSSSPTSTSPANTRRHLSDARQQGEGRVAERPVVAHDRLVVGGREFRGPGEQPEPLLSPLGLGGSGQRLKLWQPASDPLRARVVDVVVREHMHARGEAFAPQCDPVPRGHERCRPRNLDEGEGCRGGRVDERAAGDRLEHEAAARGEPASRLGHLGGPVDHHGEPALVGRDGEPGAVGPAVTHAESAGVLGGPPFAWRIPGTARILIAHGEHPCRRGLVSGDLDHDGTHAPECSGASRRLPASAAPRSSSAAPRSRNAASLRKLSNQCKD